MKDIVVWFFTILFITALIAGIDIKMRPFHVRFTNPYLAAGVILIIIGVLLVYYQGHVNTLRDMNNSHMATPHDLK